MSIQTIAWVLDHTLNIKPSHKLVLICLANYAGEDGKDAFPSVATLARHSEMSERSVQRILKDLSTAGLISTGNQKIPAAKGFPADRTPNCYNVEMDILISGDEPKNVRRKGIPKTGQTGVTNIATGVTKMTDRGDKTRQTGVTPLSPKPLYKPLIEPTTNTRTHTHAGEANPTPKQSDPATDGWLAFGHEVMAAAGVDASRSMMQAGCVRQWLADAAKAGYTRQQAEAVILDVVRERAKYGGNGKPPAWFSRPVSEAIQSGSVTPQETPQNAAEGTKDDWELIWPADYVQHVLRCSNGAGRPMSKKDFRTDWMQKKGIEA